MSPSLISTTDPAVLKNSGVPIELVQTRNNGQAAWEAHPEGVTSVYHVRFNTTRLMELESRYNTLAEWEKALDKTLLETLVASLSIGLGGRGKGWPAERVAEALEFGKIKEYRLAVSAAYAMALGRDPKAVKESLTRVEGDMASPVAAPDGTVVCCDQGAASWPNPCPWHRTPTSSQPAPQTWPTPQGPIAGQTPPGTPESAPGPASGWTTNTSSDSGSSTSTDGSSGSTSGPAGWETGSPATSSGTSGSESSSPSSNPWQ